MKKISDLRKAITEKAATLNKDVRGGQISGAFIVVLIVVVLGGLALTLGTDAFNQLAPEVVNKIRDTFNL